MALLPMLFCACSSFEEQYNAPVTPATADLQAGFAEDTRTYVENNKYLRWHEDDRLTAFYGNTLNRQYKFKGQTGDNSGSFSHVPSGDLETGNAFDRIYAVYPYDETATITDKGIISLKLPAVQQYAENSFGKGANTMIAVTENLEDTFLAFKNACGYLKLKLYAPEGGVVKSIEVKGNNNEKIAGNATATIAFGEAPVVTMADDATTSVTLDCGEGISLGKTSETATEFWVVIPEVTFTEGITITVTDSFKAIFTQSTDKEVVIERNAIQPMAALKVEGIKPQPNNEIWYTATEKVTPYKTGVDIFGANIESNTWDSETGRGVITFDSDVTQVGAFAFYERRSIVSINLPNSVESIGSNAFDSCTNLENIHIPNSVKTIGNSVIRYAYHLSEIVLPESLISIGNEFLTSSREIKTILIPENVTSIGSSFCSDCTSLNTLYCKSIVPPQLGGLVAPNLKHIYVPNTDNDLCVKLYKLTQGWSTHAEKIEGCDFYE